MATVFATVDEYIGSFPEEVRSRLELVREIARDVLPAGGERISYAIPAVTSGGRDVVYFSGWKRHVAVYPVPEGDEALARDLDPYRAGKGTLQFRHDQELPADLLRRVITALAEQRTAGSARS
jgi:uncharacterized protein YdhG (YjbR/CyaY superfamily)